jgi:GT2 family glycosyltransferase
VLLEHDSERTEIIVLNNDPSQDVAGWLRSDVGIESGDRVLVVDMGTGSDYAKAVNHGVEISRGDLLVICNADLFPSPTYIDVMRRFFAAHPRAGLATGKILRYDLEGDTTTDVIDSVGLNLGRNRRFLARGEGTNDNGRFAENEQVFGVDGAALVTTRAALESVVCDGEYFDESFHMYKDDCDLSWRMRLIGWECWYVADAIAYHARTTRGLGDTSYVSSWRQYHQNEKSKPAPVRFHSLKNQWLMLVKNEDSSNFVRDLPFIFSREVLVLGYNLVFSPRTLLAAADFVKLLPSAVAKRRRIKRWQMAAPSELRHWINRSR